MRNCDVEQIMINKEEWDRMIAGKLYNPYSVGVNFFDTVHIEQKKFKELVYWNIKTAFEEMKIRKYGMTS